VLLLGDKSAQRAGTDPRVVSLKNNTSSREMHISKSQQRGQYGSFEYMRAVRHKREVTLLSQLRGVSNKNRSVWIIFGTPLGCDSGELATI
jgi:hypothetical protein